VLAKGPIVAGDLAKFARAGDRPRPAAPGREQDRANTNQRPNIARSQAALAAARLANLINNALR
jgi:hypothetical protein